MSLSFDDGMRSHLQVVLSLLDRHELRGTLCVPCGPRDHVPGVETMTLDEMEEELAEADRRMRASFAYPCHNTFVGKGEEGRSYVPLLVRRFAAARASGGTLVLFSSPATCDLFALNSWKRERRTASELIGIVERTVRRGQWSMLTFHRVGEAHLSVTQPDFVELVEYLDSERASVWKAPLVTVAEHLRRQRGG